MTSAFKLHVGLEHDSLIPAFASNTDGKAGEVSQADQWNCPKDCVLVFDKSYSRYSWHKSLTDQGLFWVTRIRGNALYRVTERGDMICILSVGLATKTLKPESDRSSQPTRFSGRHKPSQISACSDGRLKCASNGSNRI